MHVLLNDEFLTEEEMELQAAYDYLQYIVNFMDRRNMLEEHCFTFPDGFTVHAEKYDRYPLCKQTVYHENWYKMSFDERMKLFLDRTKRG